MMTRSFFAPTLALFALCLFALSGCGASEEEKTGDKDHKGGHEEGHHEDHPETYAEAVAAVEEIRVKVKEASAADDLEAAHGPLHQIGHLLEDVGKFVDEEEMTDEEKQAVKDAAEKLMDAFGAIDAKLHGEDGSSYADVEADIDEAMKVLMPESTDEG